MKQKKNEKKNQRDNFKEWYIFSFVSYLFCSLRFCYSRPIFGLLFRASSQKMPFRLKNIRVNFVSFKILYGDLNEYACLFIPCRHFLLFQPMFRYMVYSNDSLFQMLLLFLLVCLFASQICFRLGLEVHPLRFLHAKFAPFYK